MNNKCCIEYVRAKFIFSESDISKMFFWQSEHGVHIFCVWQLSRETPLTPHQFIITLTFSAIFCLLHQTRQDGKHLFPTWLYLETVAPTLRTNREPGWVSDFLDYWYIVDEAFGVGGRQRCQHRRRLSPAFAKMSNKKCHRDGSTKMSFCYWQTTLFTEAICLF